MECAVPQSPWSIVINKSRDIFHLFKVENIFKSYRRSLNPCEAMLLDSLLPDFTVLLFPGEGCHRKSSPLVPYWPELTNEASASLSQTEIRALLKIIIFHSQTLAALNSNVLFIPIFNIVWQVKSLRLCSYIKAAFAHIHFSIDQLQTYRLERLLYHFLN